MDHFFSSAYEYHDVDVNYPFGGYTDNSLENLFPSEDIGGVPDDLWPNCSVCEGRSNIETVAYLPSSNELQCFSDFMVLDDLHFSDVSATALPPFELTPSYGNTKSEGIIDKNSTAKETESILHGRSLSTEEVMRVSAAHFIQLSALVSGDPSKLKLPFGLSYSALTGDEVRNVEIASLLMAAAEKVNNKQFDRANNLIKQCNMLSSSDGNPVQRVVYYFSEALQERIDKASGKLSPKRSKRTEIQTAEDVIKGILTNHSVYVEVNDTLPFTPVLNFTSVQAILDSVTSAKRIHIVDLSIKHGMQWTVLMQALSTRHNCPIEMLKITAVGESYEVITSIGKRLSSFASSMGLRFEFRTVILCDFKDLREDMFELDKEEALGVYSDLLMNSLLVKSQSLENLMRVLQKMKPRVMTVIDVEAKLNSRSFIKRFTEALFYFSAFFDCLDSLMEKDDKNRILIEEGFFAEGIKCILATEGSERVVRQVGIKVWRSFFARFGFMEVQLSDWSICQANLLVKQYVKDGACTLERNGYALMTGWKETPLHFISAWKFNEEEVGMSHLIIDPALYD